MPRREYPGDRISHGSGVRAPVRACRGGVLFRHDPRAPACL